MHTKSIDPAPFVFIYSKHPLAFRTIEKLMGSAAYSVRPFSQTKAWDFDECTWVLILDAYSIDQWLEVAVQCGSKGGRPIVILPDQQTQEAELRLVYLGVQGIVSIPNLENELVHAVDSVLEGKLWLRRSTLYEYVRHTSSWGTAKPSVTLREQQIIPLLAEGYSNKVIGNLLRISDRTVKFHLSNIFRKFNVKNRKSLFQPQWPHQKQPSAFTSNLPVAGLSDGHPAKE
jgi:DNA-binding NarL/FixJ family response regulator